MAGVLLKFPQGKEPSLRQSLALVGMGFCHTLPPLGRYQVTITARMGPTEVLCCSPSSGAHPRPLGQEMGLELWAQDTELPARPAFPFSERGARRCYRMRRK